MYGFFFFFKQKTAYEMRISDWSSDVCSSDLATPPLRPPTPPLPPNEEPPPSPPPPPADTPATPPVDEAAPPPPAEGVADAVPPPPEPEETKEIGRASCRERVCQYV